MFKTWLLALTIFISTSAHAQSTQPPDILESPAGSVSGQTAALFGAEGMSRGLFHLPSPIEVPTELGAPLWNVFPVYVPDAGLSEWGMGWQAGMSISRWRPVGEVDYSDSDGFIGPWGPMRKGTDGNWYPDGFVQMVRVSGPTAAGVFTAYLPDGRVATFTDKQKINEEWNHTPLAPNAVWMLTRVEDALGRVTLIHYRDPAFSGQRLLVDQISYGGVAGGTIPYFVQFNYEEVFTPTGALLSLYHGRNLETFAHRVKSVDVLSNGGLRWSYQLGYQSHPQNHAISYLSSVRKIFASAASLPPVTYTYNTGELATAVSVPSQTLTDFAKNNKLRVADLLPQKDLDASGSFYYDDGEDGTIDFIHRKATYLQAVFDFYSSSKDGASPFTRSSSWRPEAYPQMVSTGLMLSVRSKIWFAEVRHVFGVPQLTGEIFSLFPFARNGNEDFKKIDLKASSSAPVMVDLNADHDLDLLITRASPSALYARLSLSETEEIKLFELSSAPSAVWVADINGDGRVDVLTRDEGSATLTAWLRFGRLGDADGFLKTTVQFADNVGRTLTADTKLQFLDVNRDGLVDILAIYKDTQLPRLFINAGAKDEQIFVAASVPGLTNAWTSQQNVNEVLMQDLPGDGNEHLLFFNQSAEGRPRSSTCRSPAPALAS